MASWGAGNLRFPAPDGIKEGAAVQDCGLLSIGVGQGLEFRQGPLDHLGLDTVGDADMAGSAETGAGAFRLAYRPKAALILST